MAILRAPLATKNFTQVPNHWLRDGNLSARAKGILSYICSHAPGYELTVKQMVAEMKDGQDAIYAGMKELEDAGYLVRQRQRAERGRLGGVDYTIVESPESDSSYSGSARTGETKTGGTRSGKPKSGGSVTKNNNPKNTKDQNTKDQKATSSPSPGDAPSLPTPASNPDPRERGGNDSRSDEPPKPLPQRLVAKRGWSDRDATILVKHIEELNYIEGMGWWVTVDKNGTLDAIIDEAVEYNRTRAREHQERQASTQAADLAHDPWTSSGTQTEAVA